MSIFEAIRAKVLVVDDEAEIRSTLGTILDEEGYDVVLAESGSQALELLAREKPAMVLLDIWMPSSDGLEVLREIRKSYPELPVVMMSGHATIQTAVQATHIGANDFIEKPFDLETLLGLVGRFCKESISRMSSAETSSEQAPSFAKEVKTPDGSVFDWQVFPGRELKQKTLADSIVLHGQGLHSGTKSGLVLEPLPANSGIHFVGVSSSVPVPAHVSFVESTGFQTRLKREDTQIATIEHLMSALHAYGITNLLVKCNDEIPSMDGSSIEFCEIIEKTGIEEQSESYFSLKPEKSFHFGEGNEQITVEPSDCFSIDYRLEYPEPLGVQEFSFTLDSPESYKKEIAPARTFGFVKDIGFMQSKGLAQGGRFNNFVLYGEEGPLNSELRFENEAVRHKILDAIGDLFLLSRPIDVKVTAKMTGHSDNIALLTKIFEAAQDAS